MNKSDFRKVEKILYNYNIIKMTIRNLTEEVERLKVEYEGYSPIGYEERTSQTYKITSSVENEIISREKKIKELDKSLLSNKRIISMIDNGMEILTSDERKLVELRYFTRENLGWEQIGMKLGYSGDYCRTKIRERVIELMHYLIFENSLKQYSLDDFD